jgi:hypothetical protein
MSKHSSIDSLKIKAKLLQKAKRKSQADFALKDAYAILSKAAGFESWKEMKDSYYKADLLNPPFWSAQWKNWFNTKEEALLHFDKNKNFLLPYRRQFFICDKDYIEALGVSINDSDLKKIGFDWSAPQDQEAMTRVFEKIKNHHLKKS